MTVERGEGEEGEGEMNPVLKAWWKFDGNLKSAIDGSDNWGGGAPSFCEGRKGRAIYFNGEGDFISLLPEHADFASITDAGMSVAVWMRPDCLTFPRTEGEGYVHWMGKGETGKHEWVCRMYSADNTVGRENRISGYAFNPCGGIGYGASFQKPVIACEWIHVAITWDGKLVKIYRNGVCENSLNYGLHIAPRCCDAPLRVGTRDKHSFFKGAISDLRIYRGALDAEEVMEIAK